MFRDILNFFKELAATITWPMAALIIAFMFRKQLFLVLKALTRKIDTSDRITMTGNSVTLESVARKADEADKKAEEVQKDVQSLAATGVPQRAPILELEEKKLHALVNKIELLPGNDDPQKGKWDGSPLRNNRELKAVVTTLPGSVPLYRIDLEVISTNPLKPLTGKVVFHLHPTFRNAIQEVDVINGKATLRLLSYGSFTVGAVADNGATKLELDLEKVQGVPEHFKNA